MDEQSGSSVPPPLRSLEETCAKKALSELLHSETPDGDFAALESVQQHSLFKYLRKEYTRLLGVERQYSSLTRKCPYADTQIYLGQPRIEPGGGGDNHNGYDQIDSFLSQWQYEALDEHDGHGDAEFSEQQKITRWHSSDLTCEHPGADLRICTQDPFIRCLSPSHRFQYFGCRISSQLLLYRMTAIFGMPPPTEGDGYKSCWEVTLSHSDGISFLELQDYKGGADARFHGTAHSSASALDLLNFLTGTNCPHTYDGIVAGTVA